MGTKFRIVLYSPSKETADKAAKAAFARVAELNSIMSDYSPDSELMQLCKKSEKVLAGPVKVSAELFYVLQKANQVSELSGGAFDVTIGPVVKLWRQARRDRRLPEPEVLKAALQKVARRVKRYEDDLLALGDERADASLSAYRGGAAELHSVLAALDSAVEQRIAYVDVLDNFGRAWAALYFAFAQEH